MSNPVVRLRSTSIVIAAAGVMVSTATAIAALTVPATGSSYRPIQAISYDLGSKRAIGYFVQAEGRCKVTLMVADAVDPELAEVPSAARLRLSLFEGQSASLESEEGRFIDASCGKGGETLYVTEGANVSQLTPTQ